MPVKENEILRSNGSLGLAELIGCVVLQKGELVALGSSWVYSSNSVVRLLTPF